MVDIQVQPVMRRWEMAGIGRERLVMATTDVPEPGPGQVLVRVSAVALNYRDKMVIESGRGLPLTFPFTPGSDMAGTVVACGVNVSRFSLGQEVISVFTPDWVDGVRGGTARTPSYRTLGGFYPGVLAEYICVDQNWLVAAPRTLTPAEACTLPCAGLTAWFALVERGHIRPGETVLVEGTGGVSLFALQIAKLHGAHTIVSGSADKHDAVIALGADDVIDRRRPDWVETIYAITDDHGADHVLEIVGGPHLDKAVQVVAIGGRIYQIGALAGFEVSASVMPLLLKDASIQGIGTGHRRALTDLVAAVDQTHLKPVVGARFSFADLPSALDQLDTGALGKIVVELA